MKGIYYINDRILFSGLTKDETISLQQESIVKYITNQNINIVKLNPSQLTDYYTNPHALLYDLKKEDQQLDCFISYSQQVMEDYIYSYPAKWLILKSFFKKMIVIENQNDWNMQRVI
ncbi:hypothetical protein RCG24_07035 [Neobacillus sp. OS1-32]|uniref:Uncharacterized protein n=1 Tax=Neobacillus paridis TaxID=2803862 RepID=A0ABS1TRI2_9BACI|nr:MULTISPECIES: hypothetical protein [Neobacillus]MBL4952871.1 hypothetical protein [Neobacillus paridis]WML31605.1 hypothetical protein RCG24_07035 [Neobacillus sp. OS1-32]